MHERFDYVRKMWNNPTATDEECLEWVIAHCEALGRRLSFYLKPVPLSEVTDK